MQRNGYYFIQPRPSAEGRTKASKVRMKDAKTFLLTFALVSVVLNKAVLCQEFLNFDTVSTYLWLPSLFIPDFVFLGVLYCGLTLRCSRPVLSLFVMIPLTITVLFTAVIVSFEVTCVIEHRSTIPWSLTVWALSEWDQFQRMLLSKADEANIKVWMVAFAQVFWTLILVFLLIPLKWRYFASSPRSRPTLPVIRSRSSRLPASAIARLRASIISSCTSSVRMALLVAYLLVVMTLRPEIPYKKLSQTPCFTVPMEILKGIEQYRHHKQVLIEKEQDDRFQDRFEAVTNQASKSNAAGFEPLNVVLVFLESVRADIMPFDGSTPWAQRFVPNPNIWDKITPFYSNWVMSDKTLHIPLLKSAAGLTHKSLLSTLCSVYALPVQGTVEHWYRVYHACLPQILAQFNYSSIFFQPQTEVFEHQKELMSNIGFPVFFGQESYDYVHQPSDEFKKSHTANYFGYEDNVMIPSIMKWVDKQTSPFFLSYLCGITHDPYYMSWVIKWKHTQFSTDEKVNGYLNTVSYMDNWLKTLTAEFDKRNLSESTLYVIVGDHGVTLKDRNSDFTAFDQRYEEALNVGVSFHSRNERWEKILRESRLRVVNGNYTSIDIFPTILEILGIDFGDPSLLNGKNNGSFVDGRSMLHPSGQRLRFSIPNPGYTMVLRDRSFVLIRRLDDIPEAFDLSVDPEQKTPLYVISGKAQKSERTDLASWGEKAVSFLNFLGDDLYYSYATGRRCHNCTLSYLLSLESLDEWDPDMASNNYPSFDESFNTWYDEWYHSLVPESSDYNER